MTARAAESQCASLPPHAPLYLGLTAGRHRESGRAVLCEWPRHVVDGRCAQGSHGDASRQSNANSSHRGVGRVTRNRQVSASSAEHVPVLAFCCCAATQLLDAKQLTQALACL